MMKLGSDWLDFVAELAVVDVAPPTESVCVVGVGGVTVAAVPPRMMFPALQSSVKHGHTVALTLMAPSSEL